MAGQRDGGPTIGHATRHGRTLEASGLNNREGREGCNKRETRSQKRVQRTDVDAESSVWYTFTKLPETCSEIPFTYPYFKIYTLECIVTNNIGLGYFQPSSSSD